MAIQNSLNYARNSVVTFTTEQPFLFIIIGILVLRSIVFQVIKAKLKKKYITPYENQGNVENKEFYLQYYRKVHLLNLFGVMLVFVLIVTYLITKNQTVGTVLAVWVGALVITFQSFTVSLVMYFILMKDYRVGDYIKIHNLNIQGEILSIKPLYIWLAGKNNFGENLGEFYKIPNNQIRNNIVSKIDLSDNTYTKTALHIPYDAKVFAYNFNETVVRVEAFLDDFLPLRAASDVGHYRTFIGVKYKIGFDYVDGKGMIWIGFICRRCKEESKRRAIVSFLETLKIQSEAEK